MLEHKGTSILDSTTKNIDGALTHHNGGVYGKLEQVSFLISIYIIIKSLSKDWKESHAAYKLLESKRTNNSKVMLKSISRSQFGVSK